MKKVIEERRNEAYTSRADGAEESNDPQVHLGTNHVLLQEQVQKALLTRKCHSSLHYYSQVHFAFCFRRSGSVTCPIRAMTPRFPIAHFQPTPMRTDTM